MPTPVTTQANSSAPSLTSDPDKSSSLSPPPDSELDSELDSEPGSSSEADQGDSPLNGRASSIRRPLISTTPPLPATTPSPPAISPLTPPTAQKRSAPEPGPEAQIFKKPRIDKQKQKAAQNKNKGKKEVKRLVRTFDLNPLSHSMLTSTGS